MTTTPNWASNEDVGPVEMAMLDTAIREKSSWFQTILGSSGVVMNPAPGWTPQAGSPLPFTLSAFNAFVNGVWLSAPQQNVTFAQNTTSNHRYDAVFMVYTQTTTQDSSGNQQLNDVGTVTVVAGTASPSPTIPPAPSGTDGNGNAILGTVMVGWVDLPPGATTASQCTVHPTPSQLSNTLSDVTAHLLASILSGPVHGVQGSAAGAAGAGQLLQGGALRGGTGALEPSGRWYAGVVAPGGGVTDAYIQSSSNGNTNNPNSDGMFLEFGPASGSGVVNTRKALRFTGLNGVSLDYMQFLTTLAEFTGQVNVDGSLSVGGNQVLTTATTVNSANTANSATTAGNANELGGQPSSAYVLKDGSGRAPDSTKVNGLKVTYGIASNQTFVNNGNTVVTIDFVDPTITPLVVICGVRGYGFDTSGPGTSGWSVVGRPVTYNQGSVVCQYYNGGGQRGGDAVCIVLGS